MSSGNTLFDDIVRSCSDTFCRCFFPNRKDHQGSKGCLRRWGNPCRRISKRCNEWLGRPSHVPPEAALAEELKPAEQQELSPVEPEVEMDRI